MVSRAYCLILVCALLSGCVTTKTFPLCPKLAALSFKPVDSEKVVNKYLVLAADENAIRITPLSEFVGLFRGVRWRLKKIESDYAVLVCGFDSRNVIDDRSAFVSCVQHADSWVPIVRSDAPEDLMLAETKYKENCVH